MSPGAPLRDSLVGFMYLDRGILLQDKNGRMWARIKKSTRQGGAWRLPVSECEPMNDRAV
jgi:hypothetical protein